MRVLIAGGGTGGHIYPAISIAKAFQEQNKNVKVEFVGTKEGLEARLIPQADYRIHFVNTGRFNQVSLVDKIKTLLIMPMALLKSVILLGKFKPDVVIGVGGFVSLPVVLAAALLGYHTYIWEPNAFPGLANRVLSRFVSRCFVVFKESAKYLYNLNCTQVHMPVRDEIEKAILRKSNSQEFNVLVFGGSQGARAINNAMVDFVFHKKQHLSGIKIIHQTGSVDYERIKKEYDSLNISTDLIEVCEYINDMPTKYSWADIVICRAGTGTLSELAACGKAAILIPLPTAADDHQTKNALALVESKAALLLKQSELSADRLMQEISQLKNNSQLVNDLSVQVQKFHKPRAAQQIVQAILSEVKT